MMRYTVYKTVNTINGKFYIGVHRTDDFNDGYLGSGKLIKQAVAKYGERSFHKEILAVFENSSDAFELEKNLVADAMNDPLCYNLKSGGEGGFDWINRNGRNVLVNTDVVINAQKSKRVKREYQKQTVGSLIRLQVLDAHRSRGWGKKWLNEISKLGAAKWAGQHHTAGARRKIATSHRGRKNSQFGTCWITRNGENKKIAQEQLPTWQGLGWELGRKV